MGSSTIAGSEDKITVGFHAFWKRLDEAIAEYQTGGYVIDGKAYTLDDVKLVVMMGGANDWYTVDESQGIDRLGNPDSEDKEQLYGACKYIFATMLSAFPNADIVIILQPTNINRIQPMWLKEGIIRDMAQMYSLPICDCCFEWYNPTNPVDAVTYWGDDKLHMTAAGNEAIMAKLEKTVNNLPFTRSSAIKPES
jgi:lysophospholipase L1-like esterase